MPKSTRAAEPAGATSGAGTATAGEPPFFPLDVLRGRADRLARSAREACHQHRRCASVCERDDVDATELTAVLELAELADRQLGDAAEAYAKAGAKLQPNGDDAAWWHKANALWHAAREHARRHSIGDRMAKRVGTEHSAERLGELHVEFELEASALLSLRSAADAYCVARPDAV